MTPFDKTSDDDSPLGGSHRLAALLCLLGFFLLVVLSQPLLNSLGLLSTDKLACAAFTGMVSIVDPGQTKTHDA